MKKVFTRTVTEYHVYGYAMNFDGDKINRFPVSVKTLLSTEAGWDKALRKEAKGKYDNCQLDITLVLKTSTPYTILEETFFDNAFEGDKTAEVAFSQNGNAIDDVLGSYEQWRELLTNADESVQADYAEWELLTELTKNEEGE